MKRLVKFLKYHSFLDIFFKIHIGIGLYLLLTSYNLIFAQHIDATLRFGHITAENPTIIFKKYKPILNIISKEIGAEVILVQTTSYSRMQKAFLDKEIDMGILNAFSYITISDKAELIPLVRRVMNKSGNYQSYIIVRKDGNIKGYSDIKGKILAFQDPYSTSGYLVPKIMLINNGIDPEKDLKEVLYIGTHDSIIYAVLNCTADVGTVASYIFDSADPKIKDKIEVLEKSESIPLGPMVIRRDLGKGLADKIKITMLGLEKSKEGRIALQNAKLRRFEDAKDSDYDTLRKMVDFLKKGDKGN